MRCSDGVEAVLQVLLPAALRDQVLADFHQNPEESSGVDWTLELLRQQCYWVRMASDGKYSCQSCSKCQVAKDCVTPFCCFMGQAVLLKKCGWKGRYKIQDRWNPVLHQVIKAPLGNSPEDTVLPLTTTLPRSNRCTDPYLKPQSGWLPEVTCLFPLPTYQDNL